MDPPNGGGKVLAPTLEPRKLNPVELSDPGQTFQASIDVLEAAAFNKQICTQIFWYTNFYQATKYFV